MDKVSPKTRSQIMASVRSKGNRSTELRLRALLVRYGIKGWKIQATELPGKPDFAFYNLRVAVFVDGCFWHGCPKCLRLPANNRKYWAQKIEKNKNRDLKYTHALQKRGWKVIRIWEHELKNEPARAIKRIRDALEERNA